jgi:hypothetical protein
MFINDANYQMVIPEIDGFCSVRFTGSQIETIKTKILEEFMCGPDAKIPGDFFFIFRPSSGAPLNNILASQENFVFIASGTQTARIFIQERCGIEL